MDKKGIIFILNYNNDLKLQLGTIKTISYIKIILSFFKRIIKFQRTIKIRYLAKIKK